MPIKLKLDNITKNNGIGLELFKIIPKTIEIKKILLKIRIQFLLLFA